MGDRYWVSGVQLGIIKGFLVERELPTNIIDDEISEQFLGRIEEHEKTKKKVAIVLTDESGGKNDIIVYYEKKTGSLSDSEYHFGLESPFAYGYDSKKVRGAVKELKLRMHLTFKNANIINEVFGEGLS